MVTESAVPLSTIAALTVTAPVPLPRKTSSLEAPAVSEPLRMRKPFEPVFSTPPEARVRDCAPRSRFWLAEAEASLSEWTAVGAVRVWPAVTATLAEARSVPSPTRVA